MTNFKKGVMPACF